MLQWFWQILEDNISDPFPGGELWDDWYWGQSNAWESHRRSPWLNAQRLWMNEFIVQGLTEMGVFDGEEGEIIVGEWH